MQIVNLTEIVMMDVIFFALGVLGGFLFGVAITISKYKKKMWEFKQKVMAINAMIKGSK
jgi:hypothetical protein